MTIQMNINGHAVRFGGEVERTFDHLNINVVATIGTKSFKLLVQEMEDGDIEHYDAGEYGSGLDQHVKLIEALGYDPEESDFDLKDSIYQAICAGMIAAAYQALHEEAREAGTIPNGPLLREWRESYGLTQDQLAQLIGAGRRSVQLWERGTNAMPRYISMALSGAVMGKRKLGSEVPAEDRD